MCIASHTRTTATAARKEGDGRQKKVCAWGDACCVYYKGRASWIVPGTPASRFFGFFSSFLLLSSTPTAEPSSL